MAETIYTEVKKKHPKVSFATVYRNLNILADNGKIQRIEFSRGKDRFDGRMPSHAHFICESCNNLIDLNLDTQSIINHVNKTFGHNVTGHNLILTGICSKCRNEC
jgi:Fur family peroxide stress response transcriptional regulator